MARSKTIRLRDPLAAELFAADDLEIDSLSDRIRADSGDVELRTRSMALQPSTIDEATRSIGGILATEAIVNAFDVRRNMPVTETLRMDGVVLPPDGQVPLLDTHNTSSVRNQLGSIRDFQVVNGELHCRLYFSATAEREWTMVKEGHLKSISAGYSVEEGATIPAGQTRTVRNRSYTAPANQTLIVTTRWPVNEGSLTAKGADSRAKLRSLTPLTEPTDMNPRLRSYLETLGLQANADESAALTFYRTLTGEQRTRADSLHGESLTPESPATAVASSTTAHVVQRSEVSQPSPVLLSGELIAVRTSVAPTDADRIRAEAVTAERTRQARIRELAGTDVPAELVRRAVDENMDEARFAPLFLQAVRDARSVPAGAPAAHVRSHEQDCNLAALQGALLLRHDCALDRPGFSDMRVRSSPNIPNWIRQDINHPDRQRAMEWAHRFRSMSLVDVCREAVRLDGGRVTYDQDEMVRTAVSGGSLSAIFSTNIHAELLGAYVEATDTTRGWVAETDVANFQATERASMGKFGSLKKHKRGGKADHMDQSDSKESSKIARYTGQFVVDEMDIIDDRFGALEQTSPTEMGNSAAAMRPDLVYSILLANAALDADSIALFHSSHANTNTLTFDATGVQTAIAALSKQRIRGRAQNIAPRFLLTPQDLRFGADIVMTSAQRFDGFSNTTANGAKNPLAELGIIRVSDDRLGVAGVIDPVTETAYAGSATTWILVAKPGENGAKTIVVKYRRGTGRVPQIRSFVLDKGQWGLGWDIAFDIGADADDYRAMYRGNV